MPASSTVAVRWVSPTLNAFMALGRPAWDAVRAQLTGLLTDDSHRGGGAAPGPTERRATMRLPFEVADYVDFYSSEHHASNVGQIFRPGQPALTPNWKHLPIGYHGRAGTVVVSGTPIVRPCGQRKAPEASAPTYGPSLRLDIEAEVGFVVGVPTPLGTRVPVDAFADHVFGVVLLNDWSARDIQAWEYVPLGPFLGKSFATSISPWVVPLAALDAARVPAPRAGSARTAILCRGRPKRPGPAHAGRAGTARSCPAAVRDAVLDARAAARAHDGQRRPPAHRRSFRVWHGVRSANAGRPDRSWS